MSKQTERVIEAIERLDRIQERFEALGIPIGTNRSSLELSADDAEQLLDRLEADRRWQTR